MKPIDLAAIRAREQSAPRALEEGANDAAVAVQYSQDRVDIPELLGLVDTLRDALLDARGVIDQANATIQGCASSEITDPIAYAVLTGAVGRIDAVLACIVGAHEKRDAAREAMRSK